MYSASFDRPGPRDPHLTPYMIEPIRQIYNPAYDNIALICSSQMGKTESMLDVVGATWDIRPRPMMLVGPDEKFVRNEHEPRILDLIEQAAGLKSKAATGKKTRLYQKTVAGVPLRLAWATSETQLSGMAAWLVVFDEIDRTEGIKGKGDPFGIVKARGDSFRDSKRLVMSTPTEGTIEVQVCEKTGLIFWKPAAAEEVRSPIWRIFQSGTMHHWAWQCPHCGEWFIPRMSCLKGYEGLPPARAKIEAFIECPANGCVITEADKAFCNANGRYVAPGQSIDADGNVSGDPPETITVSYWVSGLCSPFKTIGERAARLVEAEGDGGFEGLQSVVNTVFGECCAPGAGTVPDWQKVRDKAADYERGMVPDGALFLTAGVDVQGYGLYYVVRAWGPKGTSWAVQWGLLHGSTIDDEVWDRLRDVIDGYYGDQEMPIKLALVDAGYRPGKKAEIDVNKVYEFVRSMGGKRVRPTRGRLHQQKPIMTSKRDVTVKGEAKKYGLEDLFIHTDWSKSSVYERIKRRVDKLGAWLVPRDVDEDYCRQVVSEARIVDKSGKVEWQPRSRDNHYLDCEAMNWAAGYMLAAQQRRHNEGDKVLLGRLQHDFSGPRAPRPPVSEQAGTQDKGGASADVPAKVSARRPARRVKPRKSAAEIAAMFRR